MARNLFGSRKLLEFILFHRAGFARGLALFFGLFTTMNLIGASRRAGFDATTWWLDLRALSSPAAPVLLGAASLVLLLFAGIGVRAAWQRWLTVGCAVILATVAA